MKIIYLTLALLCLHTTRATEKLSDIRERISLINPSALKLAMEDMRSDKNYKYDEALKDWTFVVSNLKKVSDGLKGSDSLKTIPLAKLLLDKQSNILLSNPLLQNNKVLITRFRLGDKARVRMADAMCLPPGNYMSLIDSRHIGYDAELCLLSGFMPDEVKHETLFKPQEGMGLADVQLHWDADRLMFAMPKLIDDANKNKEESYSWQIYELGIDGSGLKQISPSQEPDLEFADPCYLPSGEVLFTTNIGYNGIPCENGLRSILNLALYNPQTNDMRKISFDQDGNWCPTVLNNGKVMYTRWEYTDLTHYFSRIVMHSNPDGTETKALYGSGSYWPNSIYDMHQLPGSGSKFVGIVTGHHGVTRSGRLFIFDPAKGRKEEKGVVQELPFKDRETIPEIKDYLVDGVWPQFSRPFPINDKYFLVSAKLHKDALWGIYLVDVFDNITLLSESEGEGFINPIMVAKRPMPPVIPSKVNLQDKTSTVFIQDIYEGEGLKNIPRGVVKKLRIFTYEYAYLNSPSDFDAQGIQSGWDIKRELGEVEVEADGSVMFKVPANTPISIQPLDEKGAAVQWMRSWFTAMPGELVSCVGCHEDQNSIPMPKRVAASQKSPKELTKPKGGIRPFTFTYEIQPILDKYCISCHDNNSKLTLADSKEELYKRGVVTKIERYYKKSYLNLHPYVYRQGPEADIHVLRPYEYHASNSELVRLLAADHHGVRLSSEDWKTLYKWIDFNAPYSRSFEIRYPYKGFEQYSRRRELYKKFGGPDVDWQKEIADYAQYLKSSSVSKQAVVKPISLSDIKNNKTFRSFDSITAKKMQEKKKNGFKRSVSINDTLAITFVWIPDAESKSGKGFWMSETEITNEQFTAFFSQHDSRYIGQQWKDHTTPGYPANHPKQPVVRVSWNEAMSFCDSASRKSGFSITLPTAEEWEWACRAGSSEDMWYGSYSDDYSDYENMADATISDLAVMGVDPKPMAKDYPLRSFWDFVPRDSFSVDSGLVSVEVGHYSPNPWGLYDMHGNVAEWTKSSHPEIADEKTVCGGSWRDRAKVSSSSFRKYYKEWQAPFNVGFRIVLHD